MLEIVICSAILTKDGSIITGRRHHDCLATVRSLGKKSEIQGFLTSTNRFVNREEALNIQLRAGIESVAEGGYRGTNLYSEDLY